MLTHAGRDSSFSCPLCRKIVRRSEVVTFSKIAAPPAVPVPIGKGAPAGEAPAGEETGAIA